MFLPPPRAPRTYSLFSSTTLFRVDPAGGPVVAVGVAPAAVAAEIQPLEGREVGLVEAFVVAVDGAHLPRPAVGDAQVAVGRPLQRLAVVVDQHRRDAAIRQAGAARLLGDGARLPRDNDAAGLGLPRSEDRRVGNACGRKGSFRLPLYP